MLSLPTQTESGLIESPHFWRTPTVLTLGGAGLLLLSSLLFSLEGTSELVSDGLLWAAAVLGIVTLGYKAVQKLVFRRVVGTDLLMSAAAAGLALAGEPLGAATLAVLYSVSKATKRYTKAHTRTAARELTNLLPERALVKHGGRERSIPAKDLVAGDIFFVKPGQPVPTDGEILVGGGRIDETPYRGERAFAEKGPNSAIFAGSVNGDSSLMAVATKDFVENSISQRARMVLEAKKSKSRGQRLVERFGALYSPAVLAASVLLAVLPPLLFGTPWGPWLLNATVFLIAASPCALTFSVPMTGVAALASGARRGVLIKGGEHLTDLAEVRAVVVDEVSTFTEGEPYVTDVVALVPNLSHEEIVGITAAVESLSERPGPGAVVRHAKARGVTPVPISNVRSLAGGGTTALLKDEAFYVGGSSLFTERLKLPLGAAQKIIERLHAEGKTVIVLGDQKRLLGLLALRVPLRKNAVKAVRALHDAGVEKVVMLTRDDEAAARAVASELGVDEVHAVVDAEDKAAKVRELNARFGRVAMVGRSATDVPALTEASVGIALGPPGAGAAEEAANVVLTAGNLEHLAFAINHARRHERVSAQSMVLSGVTVAALLVGVAGGWFPPLATVIGHELGEFVAIGSSLRLLRA